MKPTRADENEAIAVFVREIHRKVKPRSIEIGYEPDPRTGEDPRPGDPVTWYVDVVLSETVHVRRQARALDGRVAMIEALAAAAEALGLSVRVRYER